MKLNAAGAAEDIIVLDAIVPTGVVYCIRKVEDTIRIVD